ncbi:GroES-like protein [Pilatotrama ljubarskyi]|nr:GroES-like protein [Pilatotrama ljubarskyi]
MATIESQKALLLHAEGEKYRLGEVPIPRPGLKEVLVKVMAAALNPLDWKVTIPPFSALVPEYPFISGTDGAGVVVEVGEQVMRFKEGDRIVFQGSFRRPYATFQQYCIVPEEFGAVIPENIAFDEAASVPLGLMTAVLALYNQVLIDPSTRRIKPAYPNTLKLKPFWEESGTTEFSGKPAFVLGGASSVGQYAIQIAKLAGFDPIITTASPRNTELLTSIGATHVVPRSLDPDAILAKLSEITAGEPVELVFDAITDSETVQLAYNATAPGCSLVVVLPSAVLGESKKEDDRKRIAQPAGHAHFPENRACGTEVFKRLTEWLEKGLIKPNIVEVLPNGLAGVQDGLERLEQNKVSGRKLVTRPQETR